MQNMHSEEIKIGCNNVLKTDNIWDDIHCIPVLENDIDYSYFFKNHLSTNTPCIIHNVSSSWQCSQTWVTGDTINFEHIIKEYGDLDAPVADCNTISYNTHCKNEMKVKKYIDYLRNSHEEILYLKDWHLRRIRPNDRFYEVPHFFSSDWLNEYALDHNEDDFMFVYMGPSKSWTPLHADVYSSYSWSVNVIGLKKWILFPPGEENKLRDSFGNLPLLFDHKIHKNVQFYEVDQLKGDGIFVPSGWHHQVTNLQDTISINHNWINGCNIHLVWQALQDNLKSVEKEIEEFQLTPEFRSQCQIMLKALFGMDYNTFIEFLTYTAQKRLSELTKDGHLNLNKYIFKHNSIKFDLNCILEVFQSIVTNVNNFEKYLTPNIINNIINIQSSILKVI